MIFYYTVEAGVSGRITFPRNGLFVHTPDDESYDIGGMNNIITAITANSVNLDYPQTHLGRMTVLTSEPSVSISVADVSANETDGTMDFVIQLSRPVLNDHVRIDYVTEDVNAEAGDDYATASGFIIFNRGETSYTVQVSVWDDDIEEDSETFKLKLINPVNVTLVDDTAIGTIEKHPDPRKLDITASFKGMPVEHDGTSSFTFELRFSKDIKGFNYASLRNNGFFQVTNGSVTNATRLVEGSDRRWGITVQPSNNNDITITLPETTNCSASGAICRSNGDMLSNTSTTKVQGTIPVEIFVADTSASENTDSTIDFTVSLSRSSVKTIKVDYTTADDTATAGDDYTTKSGTLTFTPNETSKTVQVLIVDDSIADDGETLKLQLSNPVNATLADNEAIGTINNSDPGVPPIIRMSIADASANENTGNFIDFPVTLNKDAPHSITISWATSDGTAVRGEDYSGSEGTITIPQGSRTGTVRVNILDDPMEERNEIFQVTLSNPTPGNIQLSDGTATGTINSNDQPEEPPPLPPITASFIGMPSEHDGENTFTFELRFSEDLTGFSYKTLKYNGAFTVTNGSIKNARRLARPANQRWEITVQPSNNKNISISLPPTTNCSASGAICHSDGRKLSNSSTGRILGPVGISVADASANENTDSTVDLQ